MRRAFAAADLPQPEYRIAGPRADRRPPRRRGQLFLRRSPSRLRRAGVIRADDPPAAAAAAARSEILREAGGPGRAAARRVLPPRRRGRCRGPASGRRLEVLAVFDKPDPLEVPTSRRRSTSPPRACRLRLESIIRLTAGAASALGLVEGPIHAELRIDGTRAWRSSSLRARSAGSARGLCASAGREPRGAHPPPRPRASLDGLAREKAASGVMMLPIPRAGVLEEVCAAGRGPGGTGVTGSRSRSRAAGRFGRCPRATATSASSSPAARRPRRSKRRCVPPTVGSRS